VYQNNVLHAIGSTVDHITYSCFFLMTGQGMYGNWKISDALAVWSPADYQFVNVNFMLPYMQLESGDFEPMCLSTIS